jgi:4-hydroxybenzoate polyprenyltransferase
MRPHQWVKNGFVFAALIFDQKLTDIQALMQTIAGFILFCLISSTIYIINDLADIEADRKHPTKRLRPLAAGKLDPKVARVAAVVFVIISIPLGFALSIEFALIGITYLALNLAYSFSLKHVPILDVMVLAVFYVLRVGAGVSLVDVERFSPWLYAFTIFLALFIGIGKRRAEMTLLAEGANNHRRVLDGYSLPLLDQMTIIVSSATIMTYSLYTFSAPNLPENHTMMLTIPFVIFGIFRYLYLIQIEKSGGAPVEVLFKDRPLQITLAIYGIVVLFVFYLF